MSFSNVEIDVSEEDQLSLITIYLNNKLRPESMSMFDEVLEETGDLQHAVYHAILNDGIVDAIITGIELEKNYAEKK